MKRSRIFVSGASAHANWFSQKMLSLKHGFAVFKKNFYMLLRIAWVVFLFILIAQRIGVELAVYAFAAIMVISSCLSVLMKALKRLKKNNDSGEIRDL